MWQAGLMAYGPPPPEPAVRGAVDAFAAKRNEEIRARALDPRAAGRSQLAVQPGVGVGELAAGLGDAPEGVVGLVQDGVLQAAQDQFAFAGMGGGAVRHLLGQAEGQADVDAVGGMAQRGLAGGARGGLQRFTLAGSNSQTLPMSWHKQPAIRISRP